MGCPRNSLSQNERFVATEREERAVKEKKLDFRLTFFKQMNRKKDTKQNLIELFCFCTQSLQSLEDKKRPTNGCSFK